MSVAAPARAEICDLTVHNSTSGRRIGLADAVFAPGDQFIVCVSVNADGYLSLWDRMPSDGPVERLAPGPYSSFAGAAAIPVAAQQELCLGDGADGYYLTMDPGDGAGLGRMWVIFSSAIEDHPDETVFRSVDEFRDAYYEDRFGSGAMESERAGRAGGTTRCVATGSLNYYYRVLPR